ncbi:MAG: RNA pseudouridine synthase [Bacteroides sp.]|nr:RNA pseudouridine synthase [Bacteroides sp.]
MNNPFEYRPDGNCEEAFRSLIERLEELRAGGNEEDVALCRELDEGKMLGVLVAEDSEGTLHTLYAFSGQLGSGGFHYPGFVEPVFDYLRPDGYFKTHECEISRQNEEISRFEKEDLAAATAEYERVKSEISAEITSCKEAFRRSKAERQARRESGDADEEELAAMIRQSQFEKAELHRLKKRTASRLEPSETELKRVRLRLEAMKAKRRSDSEALQTWLFSNFKVLNARGESRSLKDIFGSTPMKIPPSGAGECCGPKLLQAAYRRGWRPISMAEYWYGKPKGGEVRMHGAHYPACRGKCLPVLSWMLQGLDVEPPLEHSACALSTPDPVIIYENRWFCVVDKPSGMLSVPGKGAALSVQQWLQDRYGPERFVRMAHRLDQDTSGLLIAALGEEPLKILQALFATRQVSKTYVAELEGDYESRGLPVRGRIELPLGPELLDRPRQRVDFENGKPSVTEYEFKEVADGRSRVEFRPLTGRTHQLRVHAASVSGLGMPIAGDRLYSPNSGVTRASTSARLRLHARDLEFTFPTDGRLYRFETPVPF